MEQPRYRDPAGSGPGGGSGTAWNGTCGHPRAAPAGSGTGTAGDEEEESGEPSVPRTGSVPNSGSVPRTESVPNSGSVPRTESVPRTGSVPRTERVPNSGSVPRTGSVPKTGSVPNSGSVPRTESVPKTESVPGPGGVPGPGNVPSPESVPRSGSVTKTRSVTNSGSVPSSGSVPIPESVPKPGSVPKTGNVPNSGNVPSPPSVPSSGSVPRTGTVPGPGSVPKSGSVPSSGSVLRPENVPNTGSVPNHGDVPKPGSVPIPGGPCGCRCPPAAPPSPSRAIPCGLGCRHRGPPDNNGDPRRTRRRPRPRPEEPDREPGDSGRGPRGSLGVARAGVALCLRLLGALLALLLLFLLLLLGGLRSLLRGGSAGLRRCRQLLGERWRRSGVTEEEVTRLVAMAGVAEEELDPFRVLGVENTATDSELRRAYRRLAVLVHPDKSRDPRAEAAFKVLRAGWERVSSPERRREYETKQLAQGELARALGAFLGRLQEELRDAMDAMGCTRCGGRHRRFQLSREPRCGRRCAACGGWHPAEDGDLWAESSLLGLKVTYLACMDGHVYDVTEWAGCQRVPISPDSHHVPYHLSFGTRTAAPAGRQRAPPKGSPPSPADLQDFLARVFQGNPGWGESGGAFPTPAGAAGPPQPQGGPPRGDTKHKRRKKGRRPLPR